MDRHATGDRAHGLAAALALVAALAGCSSRTSDPREPPRTGGVRLAEGAVKAVAASPDGAWLAWLDGCADLVGRSLPPGTARCQLRAVKAGGGTPVLVASGVTTLPGSFAWGGPSGEGGTAPALAALARYDVASARGALVRFTPDGGPVELAEDVGFFGFGRDGTLGFIATGELHLAPPVRAAPSAEAARTPVAGTAGASSFELAPPREGASGDGALRALVRKRATAGAELLAVAGDGRAVRLAAPVGDYGFARSGARYAYTAIGKDGAELRVAEARLEARPAALGSGVSAFAFAPGQPALAFVSGTRPGRLGDLQVVSGDARPVLLGKEVGEFAWAAEAPRLVWLEHYDPRVHSGTAGAGGPGLAPRTFGGRATNPEISRDGAAVAYLQHTMRGGYSVDLCLALLDAPEKTPARTVAQDVFGFAFSPDGHWLYYRTRCLANASACDVERVPVRGAPGAKPEPVAQGARSFDFAEGRPERLLLTWARGDGLSEVGVWDAGKLTRVDVGVVPGTAAFLGPDARRVAYAVAEKDRQGLYVSEVK